MLMNPNMGFGVFLQEKPKTFSTMMIMEFRIMIHPEQQGRICCLCQQGDKVRYSFRHVFIVAWHFPRTFNCCCIVEYIKNDPGYICTGELNMRVLLVYLAWMCCSAGLFKKKGTTGIVDYTNLEDMKCAIKKLDGSKFRNAFVRQSVHV
ncbi:hypothetical protein TB2_001651 [Malus domestica]